MGGRTSWTLPEIREVGGSRRGHSDRASWEDRRAGDFLTRTPMLGRHSTTSTEHDRKRRGPGRSLSLAGSMGGSIRWRRRRTLAGSGGVGGRRVGILPELRTRTDGRSAGGRRAGRSGTVVDGPSSGASAAAAVWRSLVLSGEPCSPLGPRSTSTRTLETVQQTSHKPDLARLRPGGRD